MKPKPEFQKTLFLVSLLKKLTSNGAIFFAIMFLFFFIQRANAEPKPPEFYGIYLVTKADKLIEIANLNTYCFFVPGDDQKYMLLAAEPTKINPSDLKGFIVYGDYYMREFFIDQYALAFIDVPPAANFIGRNPWKVKLDRGEKLSYKSYIELHQGWSINSQLFKRKEIAPKCYYIVFRNGSDTLNPDDNVSLLDIYIGDGRHWFFGWDDPDRQNKIRASQKEISLRIQSEDYNNCVSRGETYLRNGDYNQSIQYLTKAIELNPNNVRPYNLRAAAYGSKENYDQVIKDTTKAIELDPNYAPAYMIRAMAYAKKGDREQAAKDANKVMALDPNNKAAAEFLRKKIKKQ